MQVKPVLSKSKYLTGLNCLKALWLAAHEPYRASPPSAFQQHLFRQGREVGLRARAEFPGGRLISAPSSAAAKAVRDTREALEAGAGVLFEAAFVHRGVLVRVDVLKREGEGWEIIEVKSSTRVKEEHLPDVAVQSYVLAGSGLDVRSARLMHINRGAAYPELAELFVRPEISDLMEEHLEEVNENILGFKKVLGQSACPRVRIGLQCSRPHECSFKSYCWRHVPRVSVFNIPRLTEQSTEELLSRDILAIEDVPGAFPLSAGQQRFVALQRRRRPEIDWPAIRAQLDALTYPLYFLDFETDSPALPRFAGMHPFDKLPFQYSCHILHADGTLDTCEYLHTAGDDPRPPLARSLASRVGPRGRLVAYNASFEKQVLAGLAEQVNELSSELLDMAARLWDLLEIFRRHYADPRFAGSLSIKNVLPVLVPRLSYDTLAVRNGSDAQAVWNRLIGLEEGEEKARLARGLEAYCRQDTLAMVEIYRVLVRGAAAAALKEA
jgi:hypothetical protein